MRRRSGQLHFCASQILIAGRQGFAPLNGISLRSQLVDSALRVKTGDTYQTITRIGADFCIFRSCLGQLMSLLIQGAILEIIPGDPFIFWQIWSTVQKH